MKKFVIMFVVCLLVVGAYTFGLHNAIPTGTIDAAQDNIPQKGTIEYYEATAGTTNELVDAVRTTAEAAGFNPNTAESFLEERWLASEVDNARRDNNPRKLNWVFAEVVSEPEFAEDGDKYTMAVKVLSTLTSPKDLPNEFEVHGYTQYLAEGVSQGDLVLFPAPQIDDMSTTLIDGELVWCTYACSVVK